MDVKQSFENITVVFTGKLSSMPQKKAQETVRKMGGATPSNVNQKTDILVIGDARPLDEMSKSMKLIRAEQLRAQGKKVKFISENEFLERAGLETRYQLDDRFYSLTEIFKIYPHLQKEQIRYFQKWSLLRPAKKTNLDQYFEFKDLLLFRRINNFIADGKKLRSIARGLYDELNPGVQLALSFDDGRPKGQVLQMNQPSSPNPTAEDWYELGNRYDENSDTFDDAIHAYQEALALDASFVPALVNLGNIYFEQFEFNQALEAYHAAGRQSPESARIFYNIANVYNELHQYDQAIEALEKALELEPDYSGAHFNLAVIFEKVGLELHARKHWQAYIEHDSHGEWADIARQHLL